MRAKPLFKIYNYKIMQLFERNIALLYISGQVFILKYFSV